MKENSLWLESINRGERFNFGLNWQNYNINLNEDILKKATISMQKLLGVENLIEKKFLDVGSGSGIMSLVAANMGAYVYSFDFDENSYQATKLLKEKFHVNNDNWDIKLGSVLNREFMESYKDFDIVYSWGVLHHTGDLKNALNNVLLPLSKNGTLVLAIYNDQGFKSKIWEKIKKSYCKSKFKKIIINIIFIPFFFTISLLIGLIKYKNPFHQFLKYSSYRGMAIYHDWIDWLGGYPFEYLKPEEIIMFFLRRGFSLKNLKTTNSLGCNEFVFKK